MEKAGPVAPSCACACIFFPSADFSAYPAPFCKLLFALVVCFYSCVFTARVLSKFPLLVSLSREREKKAQELAGLKS